MPWSADYDKIDLGMSKEHFWHKPSELDLPFPPLTWVKPETQQKILEKCDKEVEVCKANVMRLNGGFPLCGVMEDGGRLSEAKEEWRRAMIQRFVCRGDLGLN